MKSLSVTMLIFGILVSMFIFAPAASAAENPTLKLEVTVSLTDHPADFSEDYTIVLEAENSSCPMPEGSAEGVYKKDVSASDAVALDAISYEKPGVYKYKVSQQAGSADRWTYDSMVYNVTVYITNNDAGDGYNMNVAIYKEGSEAKTDCIIFVNEYDPKPAVFELVAKKYMDKKTPKTGEFAFELKSGDEVIETVSNTDAVVSFTDLVFNKEGIYTYTVSEVVGSDEMIIYDKTIYTVTINVYQDGDLVAEASYMKGEKEYDGEIEFWNEKDPKMGDDSNIGLWIGVFAVSLVVIVLLLILGKKRDKK